MADWKVHTYATLPSTQDYVKELVEEGLPEGIVVQALTQSKGHGRYGRGWESPMGNLYMSLLLRPERSRREAGQLSFVAAVAVSDAIDKHISSRHGKSLKWPNDILIDGKKVAGIIIENEADGYALGIGVNILSAPEEAIALKEVCERQVAVHPFRDDVLDRFSQYYELWHEKGFAPIRELWLKQAYGLGEPLTARLAEREHKGTFKRIDNTGALILDNGGKEIAITAGEVYFNAE